jgi:hypothetical protein
MNYGAASHAALCAVAVASVALVGCAGTMVPFTHEIRAEHHLTRDDLQELQFYLSDTVTLRREARSIGREIDNGRLELRSGKTIEEVVIEKDTPGVAVAVDASTISVSFEAGSAISFALRTGEAVPLRVEPPSMGFAEPPDAFPGEHGRIVDDTPLTLDGVGNYWLTMDGSSFVTFRGVTWEAVADSYKAHLVIDAEALEEVVESRTVLGGRKIGSR